MSGPSKKDWLISVGILASMVAIPYLVTLDERKKNECNSLKEQFLMARLGVSLQAGIKYGNNPLDQLDANSNYRDARDALIERCGLNAPDEAERHLNQTGSVLID